MAIKIVRHGNTGVRLDHDALENREIPNQHPIEAITGLDEFIKEINGTLETTYLFKDLDDEIEIKDKTNLIKIGDNYFVQPSLNANEIEIEVLDTNSIVDPIANEIVHDNFVIRMPGLANFADETGAACTDKTRAYDLFKDLSDPSKLHFKHINGKGFYNQDSNWYNFLYRSTKLIDMEFNIPCYISRIMFSLSNARGKLVFENVDGSITSFVINQAQNNLDITEYIVKTYVKRIYFETNDSYYIYNGINSEMIYNMFKIYTMNEYEGTIDAGARIGYVVNSSLRLVKRNIEADTITSITNSFFNRLTNEAMFRFHFYTDKYFSIPIRDLMITYKTQVGLTINALMIENTNMTNSVINIENSNIEINKEIDDLKLEQILQNTQIESVTNEIDEAHNELDNTGNVFSNLKERLDFITELAKRGILNKNEVQSLWELPYNFFTVTQNQTDFELDFDYPLGKHHLKVYVDGTKAEPGINQDYIELDTNHIRFNYEIEEGQEVVCEIPSSVGLTDKISDEEYEYDSDNRLIKLIKTGDVNEIITYEYVGDTKIETVSSVNGKIVTVYKYDVDGKLINVIGKRNQFLGEKVNMIPKLIKIRETVTMKMNEKRIIPLNMGLTNQAEIKAIALISEEGRFIAKILDNTVDGFAVYETGNVMNKIYEILPIIYSDETNSQLIYLEIENLLSKEYDITIRIDATELSTI